MSNSIDFDLELSKYGDEAFTAKVRRLDPGARTPKRTEIRTPLVFDFDALNASSGDASVYGGRLTEQLFAGTELRALLNDAIGAAGDDGSVRFRLSLSAQAPRLHSIRWETLRDPNDLSRPLLRANLTFSRHVFTARGPAVRDVPTRGLKALVVIAAPKDLEMSTRRGRLPLAPIVYDTELTAARRRLQGFELTELAAPSEATIENIVAAMDRDEFDVLYIVCHGVGGETGRLLLEDENGLRAAVDGITIAHALSRLQNPPHLVALASCSSAGDDYTTSGEASSRVAPVLAVEAGVPVVLGMQGDVSIGTASKFMETFFEEVRNRKDIDHAAAIARSKVETASDAWMPVLYMRLTDGRLWRPYGPARAFDRWDSLIGNIRKGRCTPVLGFGVYENMFGDQLELAKQWSETFRYPLGDHDTLPEIAQYLALNEDRKFPLDEMMEYFVREVLRRHGNKLDPAVRASGKANEIIVGAWRAAAQPNDPHRVLANLPCSLYVTSNFSTVLETALEEAGTNPNSVIWKWFDDSDELKQERQNKASLPIDLDPEQPLVYHLFGRLDEESSMVLTEDDYFDYLVNTAQRVEKNPVIRSQFNSGSVILLGFRMTDWNLRVLFRTLMRNRNAKKSLTSVAVQVDPDQPGLADPERVYKYLETYFGQQELEIFPGSVQDFIDLLVERWKADSGEDLTKRRSKLVAK